MAGLSPDEILNDEEKEVLALIAQGNSIPVVAKLTRSNVTKVNKILGLIYQKLGVNGAAEAVAQAFLHGVLNKYYVPPKRVNKYGGSYKDLSSREIDVLSWLARQLSFTQIAQKLRTDRRQISTCADLIMHKLGTDTIPEAIEIARLNNLLNEEILAA